MQKIKNSVNTNIMIFDEVFDSSLDSVGTDDFLKIIRFVIKDANIFVISHKGEISDKFESVIKFEKVKGSAASQGLDSGTNVCYAGLVNAKDP